MTALLRDGARRVVVASYLLAPGLFADRIATAARAAGAAVVSAPLGAAPEVADVLLDRYAEAVAADWRGQGGARPGLLASEWTGVRGSPPGNTSFRRFAAGGRRVMVAT